jgi:hypothetical protein
MSLKNNKTKDLTPLEVSFFPGESPTSEKLTGMMTQQKVALEYLEAIIGDVLGEEEKYKTFLTTFARDLGDRSLFTPLVLPNQTVLNYEQALVVGEVEHELDMAPVGDLATLLSGSLDTCVNPGQFRATAEELTIPGDWTILPGYLENGKNKLSKKLITHSPSDGGSIIFNEVTTGRGSSTEDALENTIPNLAQAESGGPFLDVVLADALTNTYLVTMPIREKMYSKEGEIVNFSASQLAANVGYGTQYELPPTFFGVDGLDLDSDDISGGAKQIPLNLIRLFDWQEKKNVEGILSISASQVQAARKIQFLIQMRADVLLDVLTGAYVLAVPGNSIAQQIKGLVDSVYNNRGDGQDMMRLFSHKNLMHLRTSSDNYANRTEYYGPSHVRNNDHSMYLHRNGFDDLDVGSGANVMRGSIVVGSTDLGPSDSIHEHYNVLDDSFKVFFGNNTLGGSMFYDKIMTHNIDHSYGGLPINWVDATLHIEGGISDLNPAVKNIFLEGDVRTKGNVVLGEDFEDSVYIQGKAYVNNTLTFVPSEFDKTVGEEGETLYDPIRKELATHNGSEFTYASQRSGHTVVVGNGVTTFGKYNGTDITPLNAAIAEVTATGGTIKVLAGDYNLLGGTIFIPANVTLIGAGAGTLIRSTNTAVYLSGDEAGLFSVKVEGTSNGIVITGARCQLNDLHIRNSVTAIGIEPTALETSIGADVVIVDCEAGVLAGGTTPSLAKVGIKRTVGFFPAYSGGCFDYSDKKQVLRELVVTAGAVVLDNNVRSAIGRGAFSYSGTTDSDIYSFDYIPVSPNLGVGGHICVRVATGSGNCYAGVREYDGDFNYLGVKWFIVSNTTLTTGDLETRFFKDTALTTELDTNTRFVRPVIALRNITGVVHFDNFNIEPLSYARQATWG